MLFGKDSAKVYSFEEIYNENLIKESVEGIEQRLCEMLCSKFSILPESVSVKITIENEAGALTVNEVRVYLSGMAILKDPHEIEEYLGELVDCRCEVIWGGEDYE